MKYLLLSLLSFISYNIFAQIDSSSVSTGQAIQASKIVEIIDEVNKKPSNNRPAFYVKGGSTNVTALGDVKTPFNNETCPLSCFDNGNNFNPATGQFTAPVKGLYFFSTNVRLDFVGSGYARVWISVNETAGSNGYQQMPHSILSADGSTQYLTFSVSGTLKLNAGDTVEVYNLSISDNNYDQVLNESSFSGHLITELD